MNIGILCSELTLSKIYRDMLSDFGDVCLFHDVETFVSVSDNFDFIVMDHQIGGKSWLNTYTKLPENKPVLVLATYTPQYYKQEFPETLYLDLHPISTMKGVYFSTKDNLDLIRFYTELESLKRTCKMILKDVK